MTAEFNFRSTPSGSHNPAFQFEILQSSNYPITQTLDGIELTFGWSDTTNLSGRMRDYNAATDQRLKGAAHILNENANNTGAPQFRIDVPAGNVDLRLALGHLTGGDGNYLRVYDDTTLVLNISNATTAAGEYADPTLAEYPEATWGSSNTPVTLNISTGIMRFDIGANEVNFATTSLAHIGLDITGPARTIADIDGDNNVQAGQTATVTGAGYVPPFVSATLGGKPITLAGNETATTCDVTIPTDIALKWGRTDLDLVLTDQTGPLTLSNVTLSPRANWGAIDLASLHAVNNEFGNPIKSYRTVALTDLAFTAAVGDQLQYETNAALAVDNEWIPTIDPAQDVTTTYAIYDDSLGVRTAEASVTWQDVDAPEASETGLIKNLTVLLSRQLSRLLG